MSVVERARIVRVPTEAQLERALDRAARGAGRAARPQPAPRPGAPWPRSRSLPDPHDAGPRGDAGPRSRLPGSGGAARRPDRRPAPRTGRPRRHPGAGRPVAPRRRLDQGPVDAAADRRPARRPRSPTRTARHRRGRGATDEPRPLRPPGRRVRRPQLAAQARGHRARDAAVRGPRRVPGQRARSRARCTVTVQNQPAGHGHHEPAARRRPDPLHRAARASSRLRAERLPGDGRPHQRQARRPARQRPRSRSPPSTPTSRSSTSSRARSRSCSRARPTKQVPVDVQHGPAPDGVDVGETIYDADRGLGHRAWRGLGREPRRGRRVVAALDPEGIDFDRDVEARPVDDNGEIVDRRRARPADGPRADPAVHQPRVADAARSTRS